MSTAAPPVRRRFETSSVAEAHELLTRTWGQSITHLSDDHTRFRFTDSIVDLGSMVAEHIDYHADAESQLGRLGDLRIGHLLQGTVRISNRDDAFAAEPGDVFCLAPDKCHQLRVHQPEVSYLRFDMSAVAAVAGDLAELDPTSLRFDSLRPVSPAHQRHWLDVVRHVTRDVLARDEVLANPMIRSETFRHLVVTALATFPNNALAALTGRTDGSIGESVDPAALRRAIEFIDEHAHEPIGLAEIAQAARIGSRGLQHAFRKHRDSTPLEYLRTVRLAGAHRDLRAADPSAGDSVAAIANRWGFTHAGRFAADYRQAYGCAPGSTLRR